MAKRAAPPTEESASPRPMTETAPLTTRPLSYVDPDGTLWVHRSQTYPAMNIARRRWRYGDLEGVFYGQTWPPGVDPLDVYWGPMEPPPHDLCSGPRNAVATTPPSSRWQKLLARLNLRRAIRDD